MCLVFCAFQQHPHFPLLLAGNRDEYYQRPTQAAHFWPDAPQLLAGRDLQSGGSWMGISRDGRFATLTNVRDGIAIKTQAPSRGELVSQYLRQRGDPLHYLQQLRDRGAERYPGFNLLLGDRGQLYYASNRPTDHGGRASSLHIERLPPGLYGLSNGALHQPWPKVRDGIRELRELLPQLSAAEPLFSLLQPRTPAVDSELPATGIPLELERLLSSRFIHSPDYGTRSSTVFSADSNGQIRYIERQFDQRGEYCQSSLFEFNCETQP